MEGQGGVEEVLHKHFLSVVISYKLVKKEQFTELSSAHLLGISP